MPNRCCVYQCREPLGFVFPKDEKRRKRWIDAVRRGMMWAPTVNSIVCPKHFLQTDYLDGPTACGGLIRKRRRLKPTAVPSVFFWNQPPSEQDQNQLPGVKRKYTKKERKDKQVARESSQCLKGVARPGAIQRYKAKTSDQIYILKRNQRSQRQAEAEKIDAAAEWKAALNKAENHITIFGEADLLKFIVVAEEEVHSTVADSGTHAVVEADVDEDVRAEIGDVNSPKWKQPTFHLGHDIPECTRKMLQKYDDDVPPVIDNDCLWPTVDHIYCTPYLDQNWKKPHEVEAEAGGRKRSSGYKKVLDCTTAENEGQPKEHPEAALLTDFKVEMDWAEDPSLHGSAQALSPPGATEEHADSDRNSAGEVDDSPSLSGAVQGKACSQSAWETMEDDGTGHRVNPRTGRYLQSAYSEGQAEMVVCIKSEPVEEGGERFLSGSGQPWMESARHRRSIGHVASDSVGGENKSLGCVADRTVPAHIKSEPDEDDTLASRWIHSILKANSDPVCKLEPVSSTKEDCEGSSEQINCDHVKSEHLNCDHVNSEHMNCDHLNYEHVNCDHVKGEHMNCDLLNDENMNCDRVDCENMSYDHVNSEHMNCDPVNSEHMNCDHVSSEHRNCDPVNSEHRNCDPVNSEHMNFDHVSSEHKNGDRVNSEHMNCDHVDSEHRSSNGLVTSGVDSSERVSGGDWQTSTVNVIEDDDFDMSYTVVKAEPQSDSDTEGDRR